MRRHPGKWKVLRVIVSGLALLWIGALFLDIHNRIPEAWYLPLRYFQIVPAMQLMLAAGGGALLAFSILMLSAALFGRYYCSFLCPLGAMQDIMGFFRRKWTRRKRYKMMPLNRGWRYGSLLLFVFLILIGSGAAIGLMDPYSHAGRIVSQLAVNPAILFNNIIAWMLESQRMYAVPPVPAARFQVAPFLLATTLFALLWVLVWRNGRIYCNTFCPVGAGLGILASRSLFRIRFDQEACTACGLCAADCKAGCIDFRQKTIDASRCVMCMNCLTSCKEGGIRYTLGRKQRTRAFSGERRQVMKMLGIAPVLPLAAPLSAPGPGERSCAISPPGSGSHAHLHRLCTACQLCVQACPSHVLQPSFLAYGLKGAFQPVLDPDAGYCNFDCVRCTEVCPTGALQPVTIDEKHRLQLGKAKFLFDYCVVTQEYKNCGACSEHCPTKAVNMVPWKGKLYIPEVNESLCVGCGACEHACPTDPLSIYVEGLEVHGLADLPESRKEEQVETPVLEEFPF